jgi:hypothetical protein
MTLFPGETRLERASERAGGGGEVKRGSGGGAFPQERKSYERITFFGRFHAIYTDQENR